MTQLQQTYNSYYVKFPWAYSLHLRDPLGPSAGRG